MVSPDPALTDEELARMDSLVDRYSGLNVEEAHALIATLRASRAEVEELKAKLAWMDEQIDSGEL